MSMGAGHYSDRLKWLVQSETTSGTAGAVAEAFTEERTLWCAKEMPTGAEQIKWSALQSAVKYRVRLRGCPGVRDVDRFQDPDTDTVFLITGVHEQDDDQVCFVTEYTEQTQEDLE